MQDRRGIRSHANPASALEEPRVYKPLAAIIGLSALDALYPHDSGRDSDIPIYMNSH